MKKVIGLFAEPAAAEAAAEALQTAGFSPLSIAQLHSVRALWRRVGCTPGQIILKDFGIGAALGIALYALFGVIVVVSEAIAGINAPLALGAGLFFALMGIFVGGILGLVFGFGDVEQESRLYLRGIRRGGVVLIVETADEHAVRAMNVLRQTNAEGVKLCARGALDRYRLAAVHTPENRFTRSLRWVARLSGLTMLLLILAFFLGEGVLAGEMPDLRTMSLDENALMLALGMTLIGIIVAWRWEATGAILIIGSTLLFETINAIAGGYWRFGPLEPFFYGVGLLFLWHWWQTTGSHLNEVTTT